VKRRWKWLAFALGLALFAFYLRDADLPAVGRRLRGIGWAGWLLPIPYLFVYLVDTWAWRCAFAIAPAVPFRTLVRIRWCGESVNNVVPSAYVGGEALKVLLLARRGVPAHDATAAALVSKTAQTVAQVLFLVAGSLAFLLIAGEHPGLRSAMAVILAGGLAVVGLLFWWQKRGVFGSLLGLLRRLGIRSRRLESRRNEWEAMDRTIAGFYGAHRSRFLACTAWFFVGWLLDTVEIWLAGRLLGLPIHWGQALAVESFTGVVKVIGMWVPGALGIQESGIVLLVRMVGGPDLLGATYALLRRGREVLYAAAGWALLMVGGGPPGGGRGEGVRG
jgi:putative membrane protein